LELHLHAEPGIERLLEGELLLEVGVGVGDVHREVPVLVNQRYPLRIGDVEQIAAQPELRAFRQLEAVLGMEINRAGYRCAAESAASTDRNFASVQVSRVISQHTDRCAALYADTCAQRQAAQLRLRERVAEEAVYDLTTIGIQRTDCELVAEHVEVAGR